MIYFLILFITLLFIFRYDYHSLRQGNKAYQLLCLVAILVSALRYRVGGDSFNYELFFNLISEDFSKSIYYIAMFEPSWLYLNILLKNVYPDFVIVQFVHAIFINRTIFYFIKKNTPFKFTAIFFYFSFAYLYFNTEIMRESIAICFFLINLDNFKKEKWKRYYLLCSLSILFHYSALFLLILPLFRHTKLTLFRLTLIISLSVLCYFSLGLVSNLLPTHVESKLAMYENEGMNINGVIYRFLCYVFLPFILIKINKSYNDLSALYSIYFFVAAISIANTAIGGRLINYFTIINILFLTNFVRRNYFAGFRYKHTALTNFILLLLLYTYSWNYYIKDTSSINPNSSRSIKYFPYTTIFTKGDQKTEEIVAEREHYYNAIGL
ncbi:MAG: EpsG family protein [Phocaeicola sp.]